MLDRNFVNALKNLVKTGFSILMLPLLFTVAGLSQSPVPTPPSTLVSTRCPAYQAPTPATAQRTLYVDSVNGNDSNSGTSLAAAWRTLAKANNSVIPGDLVYLKGVFTDQWIRPAQSGTEQNRITFKKHPEHNAVLKAQDISGGVFGVALNNLSYITIDGLEFDNVPTPFQVTGQDGHHNWFRNLYVHTNGASTFRDGAHHNRVEDSVFVNLGSDADNNNGPDAVNLYGDADNNIIVRNYFGNAGHGAFTVIPYSSGLSENNTFAQNIVNNQWSSNLILGGGSRGNLIECNEIKNATLISTHNYERMGIQVSGKNDIIRYNYIYKNKGDGILITGYINGSYVQYPENNHLYHNTIAYNGRSGVYMHIADDSSNPNANGYVRNNIIENNLLWGNGTGTFPYDLPYDVVGNTFSANNPWAPGFTDGNIFRYNNASNRPFFAVYRKPSAGGNYVYDTPAAAQAANPTWTNNRRDNPLFTNPAANDYSLQAGSPMIDQGRIIPGVVYNGAAPDLGAFETGGMAPPSPCSSAQKAVVFQSTAGNAAAGTIPNTTKYQSIGSQRVEIRLREYQAGGSTRNIFSAPDIQIGFLGSNNNLYLYFRNLAAEIYLQTFGEVVNNKMDLKILLNVNNNGSQTTVTASAFRLNGQLVDTESVVISSANINAANGTVQIGGAGTTGKFDYVRWKAGASASPGMVFGDNQTVAPADFGGWEFENNLDDANGAINLAANGTVSYENTPGANCPKRLFDYDGDGRADVSVFRPSDHTWYLNNSTSGFTAVNFGLGTDIIAPGDFDGDGKTDISVFRPSTGYWYRLNSSNNQFVSVQFGTSGDVPVQADYDGDGKADIAVWRPSDGGWYRINSSNGAFVAGQLGVSGDKPAVGDFDGDGKSDLAVFRPSNGTWFIVNSSNGAASNIQYGNGTDKIVPADYDGDGKTDIAVFRPSTGYWHRWNSGNGQYVDIQFGASADVPAPADYDNDGKADPAVFRPSTGAWYLLRSTEGFTGYGFGLNGDVPTPSTYVR
ncbi:MAG TPA: FG-GAP-like repeat-containing protein [Pyrinomonadaceae bacterium]|nr:FG-GAP-like repeat-containing protein [Pyrinomonadaceae bacterium]